MFPGFFGDMFDFDRNGDLDFFEQAAEMTFLDMLQKEEEEKRHAQDDCNYNDFDED